MSMALTARPARRPLPKPLCGKDGSGVSGSIGAAVVVVVACRGPATAADEDADVSRQNSSIAMPATRRVRARFR